MKLIICSITFSGNFCFFDIVICIPCKTDLVDDRDLPFYAANKSHVLPLPVLQSLPYIPAYKPSLELQKKAAKLRSRLICAKLGFHSSEMALH